MGAGDAGAGLFDVGVGGRDGAVCGFGGGGGRRGCGRAVGDGGGQLLVEGEADGLDGDVGFAGFLEERATSYVNERFVRSGGECAHRRIRAGT